MNIRIFRRFGLAALCLLAAGTAASAQIKVHVGNVNTVSDIGIYIADKKGYFKAEGLDVEFIPFNTAAKMIAPLGAGQLDVGGGSVSAGLYNSVSRGIKLRIVADKASSQPGYGVNKLLVSKRHMESGRFKELKDLKGMKIANSAPGASANTVLAKVLQKAGRSVADVERVYLGFPQQALALQNKAVDAALPVEPAASAAVRDGSAARIAGGNSACEGAVHVLSRAA